MSARRRLRVGLALAASALLLTGCAGPQTDGALVDELQTAVVAVADQAAAGDPTTALSQLDALQATVTQASSDGRLSSERAASIASAIDAVRADLQSLVPAEPVATPSPTPVVPEDTPEEPGPDDKGPQGPGPGKNDDKGKGKDKKDD